MINQQVVRGEKKKEKSGKETVFRPNKRKSNDRRVTSDLGKGAMKAKDVREREKIKKIEQELNLKIIKPGDAGE
jgi:hypothetical protein